MNNTSKIMIGFGKKRFKVLHLTDEANIPSCRAAMADQFKKASAGLIDVVVVDLNDLSVSTGKLNEIRVRGVDGDKDEDDEA